MAIATQELGEKYNLLVFVSLLKQLPFYESWMNCVMLIVQIYQFALAISVSLADYSILYARYLALPASYPTCGISSPMFSNFSFQSPDPGPLLILENEISLHREQERWYYDKPLMSSRPSSM